MSDATSQGNVPPTIARVLSRFRAMGREEKMQALVHYSKKLEPVPDRFRALDPAQFSVPECQTRVDLYPEFRDGLSKAIDWAHDVGLTLAERSTCSMRAPR